MGRDFGANALLSRGALTHRLVVRSKDFLRLALEAFLFRGEHLERSFHFIAIEIGEVGTQLVLIVPFCLRNQSRSALLECIE